jgi:hypothetical protein
MFWRPASRLTSTAAYSAGHRAEELAKRDAARQDTSPQSSDIRTWTRPNARRRAPHSKPSHASVHNSAKIADSALLSLVSLAPLEACRDRDSERDTAHGDRGRHRVRLPVDHPDRIVSGSVLGKSVTWAGSWGTSRFDLSVPLFAGVVVMVV